MAVERRGTPNTTLINVSGFATRKIDLIRSSTRQTEKLASAVTKGPVLAAPVGPCRPLVGCTGCLGQTNINTVTRCNYSALRVPARTPSSRCARAPYRFAAVQTMSAMAQNTRACTVGMPDESAHSRAITSSVNSEGQAPRVGLGAGRLRRPGARGRGCARAPRPGAWRSRRPAPRGRWRPRSGAQSARRSPPARTGEAGGGQRACAPQWLSLPSRRASARVRM